MSIRFIFSTINFEKRYCFMTINFIARWMDQSTLCLKKENIVDDIKLPYYALLLDDVSKLLHLCNILNRIHIYRQLVLLSIPKIE